MKVLEVLNYYLEKQEYLSMAMGREMGDEVDLLRQLISEMERFGPQAWKGILLPKVEALEKEIEEFVLFFTQFEDIVDKPGQSGQDVV